MAAYFAGVRVEGIAWHPIPRYISFPATIARLVICTNAFNVIDGVDGLGAGVGLFATATTLVAASMQHNLPLAMATAPLAAALLGFLRYNFSPATIFLGDSGSLLCSSRYSGESAGISRFFVAIAGIFIIVCWRWASVRSGRF